MLGGSAVGYARMTRRWWAPVRGDAGRARARGPADVLRLLQHALDGQPALGHRARARGRGHRLGRARRPATTCAPSWPRFRDGRTDGSWENFLYFSARDFFEAQPAAMQERRSEEERAVGITHISSRTALRVSAQVIALDTLDPRWLDPRLGDVDAERLARCPAVIVNIEYPLGLAAYNILREITEAHDTLRGVYVLGKAATLNADVGDVMISIGHPRRALGLDLLARQRVLRRRHRALPDVRLRPRQPARGHGQVDVPAEPRVPRLLLPRGVHGRRDGGRPVLQRGLRDRRRRPLPGRRGGQLLQAPDRLRDHPLRLGHAVHAGAHARRPRAELLRDGLDLRVVARDPAPRARARRA